MKKILFTQCAISLLLAGCGGGNSSSPLNATTTPAAQTGPASNSVTVTGSGTTNTPISPKPGSTSAPLTAVYTDFNNLSNLDAQSASTTASFLDTGINNQGSLTFGTTNPQTTITMTPQSDGGIAYGPPITKGVNRSVNSAATDLPVISMLCQNVVNQSSTKSTDVLVASSATRLSDASQLANLVFPNNYEDCILGTATDLNYPQVILSFDQSGNLTATDSSKPNSPRRFTATQVTNALSGKVLGPDPQDGSYTQFFAYSFTKIDGSTGFKIVQKLAPQPINTPKGVVSFYEQ